MDRDNLMPGMLHKTQFALVRRTYAHVNKKTRH
jgi:hypothetical protein